MSSGKPSDWEDTKRQLQGSNPILDNKTWLRHRLTKKDGTPIQAAGIDLMVLAGTYTVKEIADKVGASIKRVENHIEHLKDGDSRNKNTNMLPHKLNVIKRPDGVVIFALK